ncbi:MAG: NUDIX hydrolase [Prevotella sp.]|nr:NUDIX hydrolase [Prevotella sp.]
MYQYKYPHPAVTTDCVVFALDGNQLKLLLVERGFEPYKGHWAFPGGFMEIDESAETGALRELQEETGMTQAAIHQFRTFSQPGRDPRERVISVAFYALVRMQNVCAADDAARARWFTLTELLDSLAQSTLPLAFDHREMLLRAIEALADRIALHPDNFRNQPEHFTADELQIVCEQLSCYSSRVSAAQP